MNKRNLVRALPIFAALLFAAVLFVSCQSNSGKSFDPVRAEVPDRTIFFPSLDGVDITADVYMPYPESAPMIILCHRAFWSRGEYREIAPALTEAGFNVFAVDLRSGDAINDVPNMTRRAALRHKVPTRFMDSLPDMQAAVDYVTIAYKPKTLILWGSSYSSSLGLIIAKNNPDKLAAYIAFSPGEYFTDAEQGKPADWIASEAAGVKIPVFVSADSTEVDQTMAIFNRIASAEKTSFFPKGESRHGAEALFKASPSSAETWEALLAFLQPFARDR